MNIISSLIEPPSPEPPSPDTKTPESSSEDDQVIESSHGHHRAPGKYVQFPIASGMGMSPVSTTSVLSIDTPGFMHLCYGAEVRRDDPYLGSCGPKAKKGLKEDDANTELCGKEHDPMKKSHPEMTVSKGTAIRCARRLSSTNFHLPPPPPVS